MTDLKQFDEEQLRLDYRVSMMRARLQFLEALYEANEFNPENNTEYVSKY